MWRFNVIPWVFFSNWSQLPSAAVADEKVFKCWWALAGKEPLILCEPECALEASQKENIWRKQELISSPVRPSPAKQTQPCPVSLVRIGLQIAVEQAFTLTLWNHLINHRLFGFSSMCAVELVAWLRLCMYTKRDWEKQELAYQLRRGVLLWLWLLGTCLAWWICECRMFVWGWACTVPVKEGMLLLTLCLQRLWCHVPSPVTLSHLILCY